MHASYLALELFFLGVSQSVILVVSLLVKSFAAVFTDERLDPLMDPHVRIEGRGTVKRLATRATNMRLFCGVDDFVPTQRRRLSKPLIAHLHQRTESIYDSQHFISSSSIDRQKIHCRKHYTVLCRVTAWRQCASVDCSIVREFVTLGWAILRLHLHRQWRFSKKLTSNNKM